MRGSWFWMSHEDPHAIIRQEAILDFAQVKAPWQ